VLEKKRLRCIKKERDQNDERKEQAMHLKGEEGNEAKGQ